MNEAQRNNILSWVVWYQNVQSYKEILSTNDMFSTLSIVSSIVKIEPSGRYLSCEFVPLVEAGMSYSEICSLLRAEVILFENAYGKPTLPDTLLCKLQQVVYRFNREQNLQPIHAYESARVLHYLLARSVVLKPESDSACTLEFKVNGSIETLDTMFTSDELTLLAKVNRSIQQ